MNLSAQVSAALQVIMKRQSLKHEDRPIAGIAELALIPIVGQVSPGVICGHVVNHEHRSPLLRLHHSAHGAQHCIQLVLCVA